MTRILYQFPQSHFAEKGRWLLDAKGLDYQTRNLLPVANRLFLWPRTGVATIPALYDAPRWIGDSTKIAIYLDKTYPDLPLLLSTDRTEHATQLAINALAEKMGVLARQWLMTFLIDTPIPANMYYQDLKLPKSLQRLAIGVYRLGVKKLYHTDMRYEASMTGQLHELFKQAEFYLAQRTSIFAVGSQFSLADIALCSMIAPLLAPPQSPWVTVGQGQEQALPHPRLMAERLALANRELGQYCLTIYQGYRNPRGNWRGEW